MSIREENFVQALDSVEKRARDLTQYYESELEVVTHQDIASIQDVLAKVRSVCRDLDLCIEAMDRATTRIIVRQVTELGRRKNGLD